MITDGKNEDWIKDRWQAAKDMSGTSLPLPQWVAVDLGEQCQARAHLAAPAARGWLERCHARQGRAAARQGRRRGRLRRAGRAQGPS